MAISGHLMPCRRIRRIKVAYGTNGYPATVDLVVSYTQVAAPVLCRRSDLPARRARRTPVTGRTILASALGLRIPVRRRRVPETDVIRSVPRPARRRRRKVILQDSAAVSSLVASWELAPQAADKAENTVTVYIRAAKRFDLPGGAEDVTADHARAFLIHGREHADRCGGARYPGVRFTWMIKEGERTAFSPHQAAGFRQ